MATTSSVDVALISAIVEAGSLTAAGRRVGLSAASISTKLADLERRIGVRLMKRSSKTLRLTTEGQAYLEATLPVLGMLEAAEEAARGAVDPRATASGIVRLGAPIDLGRRHIVDMVDHFLTDHPKVHVLLRLSDSVSDLPAHDLDLAVRYGEMPNLTGVTTSFLARNHRVVCAAPTYLDRAGRPECPTDLRTHNCLCLQTSTNRIDRWPVGGTTVAVRGDRSSDDGSVLRCWALEGHGLILKSCWDVCDDVVAGRLEVVLTDDNPVQHPLRLVRPAGRDLPLRIRLLADHLKKAWADVDQARPERDDDHAANES